MKITRKFKNGIMPYQVRYSHFLYSNVVIFRRIENDEYVYRLELGESMFVRAEIDKYGFDKLKTDLINWFPKLKEHADKAKVTIQITSPNVTDKPSLITLVSTIVESSTLQKMKKFIDLAYSSPFIYPIYNNANIFKRKLNLFSNMQMLVRHGPDRDTSISPFFPFLIIGNTAGVQDGIDILNLHFPYNLPCLGKIMKNFDILEELHNCIVVSDDNGKGIHSTSTDQRIYQIRFANYENYAKLKELVELYTISNTLRVD